MDSVKEKTPPARNDVKLDTPHHGTSWTHGDEEKDHDDQPKDEL